ncbi:AAA family ATPase [Phytomonospora sp. NPDC050363]|uniref:helix-turn-helix transcriptional regulator n=1 Tax=Phytomonospora sp. NPDC050363 TaxID=3155642 RepID=UPI0033CF6C88
MSAPLSPVFAGRVRELAELRAAFADSAEGPAFALVAGEAGLGKTRLLAEFTAGLGDVRVLTGECLELGGLPYAPFVSVVRAAVRELGADAVAAMLPGTDHELARLLPVLGAPPERSGASGRARLFEEVLALFEALAARRPTVVVFEDLHWADASTVELLLFVVRNLGAPGVLVVATLRAEESAHLAPLLAGLSRVAGIRRVEPARFTVAEVAEQLAGIDGRAPDPAEVARLHERSEGIPLFVETLDRSSRRIPAGVREMLLSGLTDLPDRSRTVLRAASVIGVAVPHTVLADVTGLDESTLDTALRPLADRALLVPDEHGYRFRHALIRSAVADGLLPGERVRLHAACARALAENPGDHSAALAAHWHAAGDPAAALVWAWRAARSAGETHAHAEQLRLLERVLELWREDSPSLVDASRSDVLAEAVAVCLRAGEFARGIALAGQALAALGPEAAPEARAALLSRRGRLKYRADGHGRDDLLEAVRLLPADRPGAARGHALAALAGTHLSEGEPTAAFPPAAEALHIGRATGDTRLIAVSLLNTGICAALGAAPGPWAPALAEARALAETLGDGDLLTGACFYEARAHAESGAFALSATAAAHGLEAARRHGLDRSRGPMLAVFAVEALIALGDRDEARRRLYDAFAVDPSPLYRGVLLALRGLLDLADGDPAAASAALADLAALDGGRPEVVLARRVELACRIAVATGDPDTAGPVLAEVLATTDPASVLRPWLFLPSVARVLAEAGESARRPWRDYAEATPVNGPLHEAARALTLAGLTGAETARWDASAALWRALALPHGLAESLLGGAAAAAEEGDRDGAAQRIREAAEATAAFGDAELDRRVTELAARMRVALPGAPAPATGSFGLTPREQDVLALVAEGRSNRQIAAELFISVNTVSVHVSRMLPKLGAGSRTEAAAVARRVGLLG